MRDCENVDVRDVLPDYVSGALDAAARARVESHLDACEACRGEVRVLHAVRATHRAPAVDVGAIVARLPKPAAVPEASPAVVSLDAHRARRTSPSGAAYQWRRAAGIVAVLFAGGVAWGVVQRQHGGAPDAGLAPESVAVRRVTAAPAAPVPVVPAVTAPTPAPRPAAARVDVAGLGSLGGVASDASDDEVEALMSALGDISGVPEVEAVAQEGGA